MKSNYVSSIAFYEDESVSCSCGESSKYAFITQGGHGAIQKTSDGGKSWEDSYNGVFVDTINAVNFISSGIFSESIIVTAVSGIEMMQDMGGSWVDNVDFRFGEVSSEVPGYAWCAVSPSQKVAGKYDLLVSTGYPNPFPEADGIFGINLSKLIEEGILEAERLVEGPHYEMAILNGKLYAGSLEDGISVLDLEDLFSYRIEVGSPVSLVRAFDGRIFFATYEDSAFVRDMWRWKGKKGKVYLLYEDGTRKEISGTEGYAVWRCKVR